MAIHLARHACSAEVVVAAAEEEVPVAETAVVPVALCGIARTGRAATKAERMMVALNFMLT